MLTDDDKAVQEIVGASLTAYLYHPLVHIAFSGRDLMVKPPTWLVIRRMKYLTREYAHKITKCEIVHNGRKVIVRNGRVVSDSHDIRHILRHLDDGQSNDER